MEVGFLVDATYGGVFQARWAAGVPTRGWLSPVAKKHFDHAVPITTFRCPNCGMLESYSPLPAEQP